MSKGPSHPKYRWSSHHSNRIIIRVCQTLHRCLDYPLLLYLTGHLLQKWIPFLHSENVRSSFYKHCNCSYSLKVTSLYIKSFFHRADEKKESGTGRAGPPLNIYKNVSEFETRTSHECLLNQTSFRPMPMARHSLTLSRSFSTGHSLPGASPLDPLVHMFYPSSCTHVSSQSSKFHFLHSHHFVLHFVVNHL